MWTHHAEGPGHDGPAWTSRDAKRAETYYSSLSGKAKLFIDVLLDHPGRQLTLWDIAAATNSELKNSISVAAAIRGLPQEASGRRHPFSWWSASPNYYGIPPSVAALFNQIRVNAT